MTAFELPRTRQECFQLGLEAGHAKGYQTGKDAGDIAGKVALEQAQRYHKVAVDASQVTIATLNERVTNLEAALVETREDRDMNARLVAEGQRKLGTYSTALDAAARQLVRHERIEDVLLSEINHLDDLLNPSV